MKQVLAALVCAALLAGCGGSGSIASTVPQVQSIAFSQATLHQSRNTYSVTVTLDRPAQQVARDGVVVDFRIAPAVPSGTAQPLSFVSNGGDFTPIVLTGQTQATFLVDISPGATPTVYRVSARTLIDGAVTAYCPSVAVTVMP